ncbi:MAG: cytochrome c biogenesis protein CcdA [Chloroflexi bacterium]|nr:cytochrome c biogenesis protein CcdA [Chloroflexota bacterium]
MKDVPVLTRQQIHSGVLGIVGVVTALALAVGAALLTGRGAAAGVERLSTAGTVALDTLAAVLPFGYAFGAGMVAAVNPCGFALLPAYLGLYLRSAGAGRGRWGRLGAALRISLAVTAGFVVLFGLAGVAISLVSGWLARSLPLVGLGVGVALVLAGGALLSGRSLVLAAGEQVADRLGPLARRAGLVGFFAYGLAYGAASLSCALPIFLTVVGTTLVVEGAGAGIVQFFLYALGMGFVVTVLTLAVALFRSTVLAGVRPLLRSSQLLSAVLLLAAGAYLVYYWLTLGRLLLR